MAQVGDTIRNPVTNLEITWVHVDPDRLEWDDYYPRQGLRVAPHVHPKMKEHWHIVEGIVRFRIDDEEHEVGPGEGVEAPPGTTHAAWNVTHGARMRVSMTPALRWAEVVEQLVAWAEEGRTDENGTPETSLLIELLQRYPDELAPPSAPPPNS
jgi:mannose-6-phosphate isomerase-like protein (cupin superfamily)